MRTAALAAGLVASLCVAALADEEPLESAARLQVGKQVPDAKLVGSYLKGATERSEWTVPLESGQCYWFSGTSEGAVKNLALTLLGTKGNHLTDGNAVTGQATMAHCATQTGTYKVQAKIEGTGSYVVGVFARQPQTRPVATGPDLGPACDKLATARTAGAKLVGSFFDGEGSTPGVDRAEYAVELKGGRCYVMVGCVEPEHIKSLSLALWGPDGQRVVAVKKPSATPTVGRCVQTTGTYKIRTQIKTGSGHFKVGVYAK